MKWKSINKSDITPTPTQKNTLLIFCYIYFYQAFGMLSYF